MENQCQNDVCNNLWSCSLFKSNQNGTKFDESFFFFFFFWGGGGGGGGVIEQLLLSFQWPKS